MQRQLNQTASEERSKAAAVWDKREFNCIREDTAYNRVAEFQVIFTEKNTDLKEPAINLSNTYKYNGNLFSDGKAPWLKNM